MRGASCAPMGRKSNCQVPGIEYPESSRRDSVVLTLGAVASGGCGGGCSLCVAACPPPLDKLPRSSYLGHYVMKAFYHVKCPNAAKHTEYRKKVVGSSRFAQLLACPN